MYHDLLEEAKIILECLTREAAKHITGGLSKTAKMPCKSYSLPAVDACPTGCKLRAVPDAVCATCYATRGRYQMTRPQQQDRLIALDGAIRAGNAPLWCAAMARLIGPRAPYFRWFDSGDIYHPQLAHMIRAVIALTPKTNHWLPTREWRVALDAGINEEPNVTIRRPLNIIDQPPPAESPIPIAAVARDPYQWAARHGGIVCPATTTRRSCDACRHCWDAGVPTIVYKLH